MSAANEAIARVRKIDALTREASIIKTLLEQINAGNVRLGVMDRYGQPSERSFKEFPTTSTERFLQIGNARVEELSSEIEAVRAEFGAPDEVPEPAPLPLRNILRRVIESAGRVLAGKENN